MEYQIEENMAQVESMMKDERKVVIIDNMAYQVSKKRVELHDEVFGFYSNHNNVLKLITAHSIIGRRVKMAMWEMVPSPFISDVAAAIA